MPKISNNVPKYRYSIVLVLHNIRSTYNVGSIIRSAECLGVRSIYCTGYTPYTYCSDAIDPPHTRKKIRDSIHKTSLGAELKLPAQKHHDVFTLINELKKNDYYVAALEQADGSIPIYDAPRKNNLALILGEEVNGISIDLLKSVDGILEIPMLGSKESFNVSVATAIALYELRREYIIAR